VQSDRSDPAARTGFQCRSAAEKHLGSTISYYAIFSVFVQTTLMLLMSAMVSQADATDISHRTKFELTHMTTHMSQGSAWQASTPGMAYLPCAGCSTRAPSTPLTSSG